MAIELLKKRQKFTSEEWANIPDLDNSFAGELTHGDLQGVQRKSDEEEEEEEGNEECTCKHLISTDLLLH